MATRIAEAQFFEDFFKGEEGFVFRKDPRGNLIDVTLPHDYELISKTLTKGLLQKISFKDRTDRYYEFEF